MKILITAPYTDVAQEQLREKFGEIIYKPWKPNGRAYNEQELFQLLESTGANALITEHDEVTEKVITGNTQLEFIGVCRGTPSNVAIDAASEAAEVAAEEAEDAASAAAPLAALGQILPVTSRASVGMVVSIVS